jgi:mRNA-degrading endonuclease toxin of MazEF toxin-antitoxin module
MIKLFIEWCGLKRTLDAKNHQPPFVCKYDVWWFCIGQNVGSKIAGKSSLFSRPAVILKKLSHGFYLIAPTTTKMKVGSWYVSIRNGGKAMRVCLHQIRTVDYRRLMSKIGTLDEMDVRKVRKGFQNMYV